MCHLSRYKETLFGQIKTKGENINRTHPRTDSEGDVVENKHGDVGPARQSPLPVERAFEGDRLLWGLGVSWRRIFAMSTWAAPPHGYL